MDNRAKKLLRFTHFSAGIVFPLLLAGCLDSGELAGDRNVSSSDSYIGCSSGSPIDAQSVVINFSYPQDAKLVTVYRNGIPVCTSDDSSVTSCADVGLTEGVRYRYTCQELNSSNRSVMGTNSLVLAPASSRAPTFGGITNAVSLGAHSVQVSWGASSGAMVHHFKVYYQPALYPNPDPFTSPTVRVVPAGNFSTTFVDPDLGDELQYTFGVRACTYDDQCDINTQFRVAATTDGGAPRTTGLKSAVMVNGNAVLNAPWSHKDGAVGIRKVFKCFESTVTPTTCASFPTNYTIDTKTYPVVENSPDQTITVTGIIANKYYSFVVQDTDHVSGNSNNNTVIKRINSGKVNRPVFPYSNLTITNVTPTEKKLHLEWPSINNEAADPLYGADYFNIYIQTANYPIAPLDPCLMPSTNPILVNNNYPAATTLDLINLTARTNYAICVRAKDSFGNESLTSYNTLTDLRATLDTTAPDFFGVQSSSFYDTTNQLLKLVWNPSSALDLEQYRIRIWKNIIPTGSNDAVITSDSTFKTFTSTSGTGMSLSSAQFVVANNERVYAVVQSCDNAQLIPNGTKNCSSENIVDAQVIVLGVITPPQNFSGISSAVPDNNVNGRIRITWTNPATADLPNYSGYNIYTVSNNNLTFIQSCNCLDNSCSINPRTYCDVTITSQPGKTLNWFVRGHDIAIPNNETAATSPYFSIPGRTGDSSAPSFPSALTGTYASLNFNLSWAQATDNQSSTSPDNVITYQVYRRLGSAPDTISSTYLISGANLISRTFADPAAALTQGSTYYYEVCALDLVGNKTCDTSNIPTFLVPDAVPPTIANFRTLRNPNSPTWDVNFLVYDNIATQDQMLMQVFQCTNAMAADVDCTLFKSGLGGSTNFVNEEGYTPTPNFPIRHGFSDTGNTDLLIHFYYKLIVYDTPNTSGNKTTLIIPDLAPAPIVTSIDQTLSIGAVLNPGDTFQGNQTVTINGSNFDAGAYPAVGPVGCDTITYVNSNQVKCKLQSGYAYPMGLVDVKVINPDQQEGVLSNAFRFQTFCELYGSQTPFAGSSKVNANGTGFAPLGTSGDPYVICTRPQFLQIATSQSGSFKLMADLNFSGYTGGPLTIKSGFTLEGNNHTISNYTYSAPSNSDTSIAPMSTSGVGLFNFVAQSPFPATSISNLTLDNFVVTGFGNVGASALFGTMGGQGVVSLTDVTISRPTLTANNCVGSVVGTHPGGDGLVLNLIGVVADNVSITGSERLGGLIGCSGFSYGSLNIQKSGPKNTSTSGNILIVPAPLPTQYSDQRSFGGIAGVLGDDLYGAGILLNGVNSTMTISTHPSITTAGTVLAVGGIIGTTEGSQVVIKNSNFSGSLIGVMTNVGGIGGWINGDISKSFFSGTINVSKASFYTFTGGVGGIIGSGNSTYNSSRNVSLSQVYSSGSISVGDNSVQASVGGLIGLSVGAQTNITDSFSTSAINVQSSHQVGGIVGSLFSPNYGPAPLNINRVYFGGVVNSNILTSNDGSLYYSLSNFNYYASQSQFTVQNSFVDSTLNSNLPIGTTGVNSTTTTNLSLQSTFSSSGWDFVSGSAKWIIPSGSCQNGGKPYPILKGVTPGC